MPKNLLMFVLVVLVAAVVLNGGCSKEERDAVIDRVSNSAKALNGDHTDTKSDGEGIPEVVGKQREAERKRQNTQWTPENQKTHPMEYCQAQLKVLDDQDKALEFEKIMAE